MIELAAWFLLTGVSCFFIGFYVGYKLAIKDAVDIIKNRFSFEKIRDDDESES